MGSISALLILLLQLYSYVILARVLLSWIPNIDRSNPTIDNIIRVIYDITEPVLRPIRNALPPTNMGFDFSPLIVFVGIMVLIRIIAAF